MSRQAPEKKLRKKVFSMLGQKCFLKNKDKTSDFVVRGWRIMDMSETVKRNALQTFTSVMIFNGPGSRVSCNSCFKG